MSSLKVNTINGYLLVILGLLPWNLIGQVITTVAGTGVAGFAGDSGFATSAELNGPTGLFFTNSDELLIADTYNDRIRKINGQGVITTIAGGGAVLYGDGGAAINAWLNRPTDVCLDTVGNVLICDQLNNVVRKVDTADIITLFAGNYSAGYCCDGGAAVSANLNQPSAIKWQGGNVYIADRQNHRIRVVNSSGIINSWAGNGSGTFSGDGGSAAAAGFCCPSTIIFQDGDLYLNDGQARIRRIDVSNTINTVCGNGIAGFNGDGSLASLASVNGPRGMVYDSIGNLFFADRYNHRVRRIDTSGIITTIVGSGSSGYTGDGGPALGAELSNPSGLALDSQGNLYISDFGNNVIRKVTDIGVMSVTSQNFRSSAILYPNPCDEIFYLSINSAEAAIKIRNLMGEVVFASSVGKQSIIDVKGFYTGVYFVEVNEGGVPRAYKILVQH